MTLHPAARYVAVHCTKGDGGPKQSLTLAADYERGTPDVVHINNQKVASFDACRVVVADDSGVCAHDAAPVCDKGDCSLAVRPCD